MMMRSNDALYSAAIGRKAIELVWAKHTADTSAVSNMSANIRTFMRTDTTKVEADIPILIMCVRSWGCLSSDPSCITLYAFLVILPKNRELFSFERTLGMNCEHGLVTAEFTGCQV